MMSDPSAPITIKNVEGAEVTRYRAKPINAREVLTTIFGGVGYLKDPEGFAMREIDTLVPGATYIYVPPFDPQSHLRTSRTPPLPPVTPVAVTASCLRTSPPLTVTHHVASSSSSHMPATARPQNLAILEQTGRMFGMTVADKFNPITAAMYCNALERALGPWGPLLVRYGDFLIDSRVDSYTSKYSTFHLGSHCSYEGRGPPVVVAKMARDFAQNDTIVREHHIILSISEASGGCAALPWVAPETFLKDDRRFFIERSYSTDLEHEVRLNGPLPWPRAALYMTSLLAAVEAAHIAGFHHLDINPSNMFLDTKTNECVLADWGGSRPDGFPGVPWTTIAYTLDDIVSSSLSVDLTAAATTLYHLITGSVPQFQRVSQLEAYVTNGCRSINGTETYYVPIEIESAKLLMKLIMDARTSPNTLCNIFAALAVEIGEKAVATLRCRRHVDSIRRSLKSYDQYGSSNQIGRQRLQRLSRDLMQSCCDTGTLIGHDGLLPQLVSASLVQCPYIDESFREFKSTVDRLHNKGDVRERLAFHSHKYDSEDSSTCPLCMRLLPRLHMAQDTAPEDLHLDSSSESIQGTFFLQDLLLFGANTEGLHIPDVVIVSCIVLPTDPEPIPGSIVPLQLCRIRPTHIAVFSVGRSSKYDALLAQRDTRVIQLSNDTFLPSATVVTTKLPGSSGLQVNLLGGDNRCTVEIMWPKTKRWVIVNVAQGPGRVTEQAGKVTADDDNSCLSIDIPRGGRAEVMLFSVAKAAISDITVGPHILLRVGNDIAFCEVPTTSNDGDKLYDPALLKIAAGQYPLGSGSYGTVFRGLYYKSCAEWLPAAVKVFKAMIIPSTVSEEARIWESLGEHENIIRLFAFTQWRALPAFVSEPCNSGSLQDVITSPQKQLPEAVRIKLLWDAAKGIEHMHSCGVLHRDIKPDNVLISRGPDGVLIGKVCDFGEAVQLANGETQYKSQDVVGTYYFIAPECFEGRVYSRGSDTYSFALTMRCVLQCEAPPEMYDPYDRDQGFINGKRPTPTLNSQFPVELHQLIENCWDSETAKRPTFAAIVFALREMGRKFCPDEWREAIFPIMSWVSHRSGRQCSAAASLSSRPRSDALLSPQRPIF